MTPEPVAGGAAKAGEGAKVVVAPEAGEPQRFSLPVKLGRGSSAPRSASLAAYRWPAAQVAQVAEGRVPLVIVHGFAEHARRHSELANAASTAGHEVTAVDLSGHGESPGPRGVVPGYGDALEAVGALLDRVEHGHELGREQGHDARRAVLFGHSMGGAVALQFALEQPHRLAGLVLSSPFLIDAVERPAWLLLAGALVAKLAPRMVVTRLDPQLISREPAEVERYRSDPLNSSAGVPAITGHTLTNAGTELLIGALDLAVPTLVVHGDADGVAAIAGSRRLQKVAKKGIVDLVEIPGGYHELLHDAEATGVPQRVANLVLEFLVGPMVQAGSTRSSTNFR